MKLQRRALLALPLAAPAGASLADDAAAERLRRGGLVVAFRHALAPGNGDPPGFRLDDCSTQRNLGDEGRVQAHRIGSWFAARQLVPARVRSSPWCRCLETARLAFGSTETWDALASPRGGTEPSNARSLMLLRAAIVDAGRSPARFEVWVTHGFVLADLVGGIPPSGEGLLLRSGSGEVPAVVARIVTA